MSVQPKGTPAERQQFLRQLPQLMKDLNAGLDRIHCPDATRQTLFAQLLPAHADSLKGQSLSTLEHNLLARRLDTALATPLPDAADLPALNEDARFKDNPARLAHREALVEIIAARVAAKPMAYWIETLENVGVPCGPINTIDQVFADPHVQARGAVETMTRTDGTEMRLVANPIRMSATPPTSRHPSASPSRAARSSCSPSTRGPS